MRRLDVYFKGEEADQWDADHSELMKIKRRVSIQEGSLVVFKVGDVVAKVYEVRLTEVKLVKVLQMFVKCIARFGETLSLP